ncbi:MAG: hypothetical protein UDB11_03040 [Peptococcaceae bacterium]|nr:hypothetical protein [Peptococcaceae bacterium]
MTVNMAIAFFILFTLGLIVLDFAMVISLLRSGDERRQVMVWKASTFTLLATVGVMIVNVIKQIVCPDDISMPFSQLGATAILYFCTLFYYKRKLGG